MNQQRESQREDAIRALSADEIREQVRGELRRRQQDQEARSAQANQEARAVQATAREEAEALEQAARRKPAWVVPPRMPGRAVRDAEASLERGDERLREAMLVQKAAPVKPRRREDVKSREQQEVEAEQRLLELERVLSDLPKRVLRSRCSQGSAELLRDSSHHASIPEGWAVCPSAAQPRQRRRSFDASETFRHCLDSKKTLPGSMYWADVGYSNPDYQPDEGFADEKRHSFEVGISGLMRPGSKSGLLAFDASHRARLFSPVPGTRIQVRPAITTSGMSVLESKVYERRGRQFASFCVG